MKSKKIAILLLPLMLLAMISFATAHWYDNIIKQYKLHAGTVKVEVMEWNILGTTSYDVNCNDEIFGDELVVNILLDEDYEVAGLQILADPIFPCWELTIEMTIRNIGSLSIKLDDPTINFAGPFEEDPCWQTIEVSTEIPEDYFTYEWQCHIWYEDFSEWVEMEPTTFVLKPGQSVRVTEFIHFVAQEYPELQNQWFRIDTIYPFYQYVGVPVS